MITEYSYNPGAFTGIDGVWGQQLWDFLNESNIIQTMKNASDNGRPAAEVIASELLQRFHENIRQDRVKQFVGFLIRQVMEKKGYIHKAYGKQIKDNSVFASGSVYSRRNA